MTRPILPRKWFIVVKDFDELGLGFGGDLTDNLDDAVDHAIFTYSAEREPFRIFQVDMDPDTGQPECIRDVTEDAINERNDLLANPESVLVGG